MTQKTRGFLLLLCQANLNHAEISYVYLFLKSKYVHFQNSGVGIAIPGISRDDVNSMLFPLPPLEEQRRIMVKVEELLALCGRLAGQLTSTHAAREHLLDAILAQPV